MSLRARKFAAGGLVAVLALAGGYLFLGRGQSSTPAAVPVIKPLHPVGKHRALAASATKPKAKAKAKPAAKPKAPARPKKKRALPAVINGMPATLALALRSHSVVVVALYAPDSDVDKMAREEAQEGAAQAGAGFVALDVSNEKVAAPLTSLLTGGATAADRVLDDPAVLVFQAPSTLFVRLNGWTDRDTVAQAAANAATGSQ
ncbi:MAG: hypothetical protein ACXVRE_01535 [Gaiellaceae bacterium]